MAVEIKIDCPAASKCWRAIYSQYYQEVGYTVPPPRETLFFAGYAPPDIMPHGGIFAEKIPFPGNWSAMCPVMQGHGNADCGEFKKYERRRKQAAIKKFRNKSPRMPIPRDVRRAVAARDNYKCVYCGIVCGQYRNGKRVRGVIDHFVPLALGGAPLDPDNLVFSCRDCNQAKGEQLWQKGCRRGYYSEH